MRITPIFLLLLGVFTLGWGGLKAQQTYPYNGISDPRSETFAFTNATIYVSPTQVEEGATLLIKEGRVVAVGNSLKVPGNAIIIDCTDKVIYPSFIDLYAEYGVEKLKRGEGSRGPQMLTDRKEAVAWNEALRTDYAAHADFEVDAKTAQKYRKMGFGAVLSHRMDGISRGSSTVVALGEERPHEMILQEQAAHHLSFSKGTSSQNYPSSLMGSIALLRQTYYDGQWYAASGREEEVNLSLAAWNELQELPQIFEGGDPQNLLRVAKLGEEFGVSYIVKESGQAYQRLSEIKATGMPLIVPLDFPDAFDVEDPLDAMLVDLDDMWHWEMAPANPARIAEAKIPFVLTADGLGPKQSLHGQIRKAMEYGLDEEDAFRALTTTPAEMIGVSDQLGTLEAGKLANFVIASDKPFAEKSKIYENWVLGNPYQVNAPDSKDLSGKYQLNVGRTTYNLEVSADQKMEIVVDDSTRTKVKFSLDDNLISLSFSPEGVDGKVRLSGAVENELWSGRGQSADGRWVNWKAVSTGELEPSEEKEKEEEPSEAKELPALHFPFNAYGWTEDPKAETTLFQNATVWTNEADGILQQADVLIQDGKIAAVGKGLKAPKGATIVDANGKHITPGIIDEHSHIAVSRGVNEGTQASSAEVRIGDVVDAEDINIYRQLAGGVTTSQLLHGSANPIGGQSAIIKLRWGRNPETMQFKAAAPFIKFALGENVKQSNWGDSYRERFPQTRMGVEQVYEDYFTRAREYAAAKAAGEPVRTDLELEALAEILASERFITCHSYRQSEINMLMKVAERFGFRVNTFTHILEGYKVADIMAEHGAGGSSFSDWWAYKFEVYDAIPYNGTLMHQQGVTVAFNSDDAEMARRLNQEAAKAVKYGGLSEEEALKFVTLNPAKLLHIDDRVGSIKVGKDADIVVWNDHPLSIYTRADMTFVDGIRYFDRAADEERREWINQERNRLIQAMLDVKKGGGRTRKPSGEQRHLYHCDDMQDEGY
jgi:imidazolonepropionase-like amidohydrolase